MEEKTVLESAVCVQEGEQEVRGDVCKYINMGICLL